MLMTKIGQVTVGAGGAASITFSDIPQIYTDLLIVGSTRVTGTETQNIVMNINGDASANYSYSMLFTQNGATPASATETSSAGIRWFYSNASNSTLNTFSSFQLYVPNYRSSSAKSVSYEHTTEQNGTSPFIQGINAGLWNNPAAINSLMFTTDVPASVFFVQHSRFSLYGINRQQAIGKPKAIGGNITFANGHWVHTFTGSGTFSAQEDITCEYVVVAGGGGGSFAGDSRGGSGAGGYRASVSGELSGGGASAESVITLPTGFSQAITVGAGGNQGNGSNSIFGSIIAIGGGDGSLNASGGSGGGANYFNLVPGSGTAGQGFAGGAHGGQVGNAVSAGAGGGGAGQAGVACNSGDVGSNGGNGVSSSITGISIFRAGGGGGAVDTNSTGNPGVGGAGGGGTGGNRRISVPPTGGAANTGGGAGGSARSLATANGGSGVVIVRYRA